MEKMSKNAEQTVLNESSNVFEDDEDEMVTVKPSEQSQVNSEFTYVSKKPVPPIGYTAKKGSYNPMYQCPPPQACYYQPAYPQPDYCQPTSPPAYYPTQPHSSRRDRGGCGGFLQGILACTLCLTCCKICCCCCEECCD